MLWGDKLLLVSTDSCTSPAHLGSRPGLAEPRMQAETAAPLSPCPGGPSTAPTHRQSRECREKRFSWQRENKSMYWDRGLAAASKTDTSLCSFLKGALRKRGLRRLTVQSPGPRVFTRTPSSHLGGFPQYFCFTETSAGDNVEAVDAGKTATA